MTIRFRGRKSEASCVYCREGFDPSDPGIRCHGCATALHQECRDELSRCPTLGCGGRWSDREPRPTRARPTAGVQGVVAAPPRTWASILSNFTGIVFGLGVLGAGLWLTRETTIEQARSGKLDRDNVSQVVAILDQASDRVRDDLVVSLRSAPRDATGEMLEAFAKESTPIRELGRKILAEREDRGGSNAWSIQVYLFGGTTSRQRILAAQVLASMKPRHLHGTAVLQLRRMATSRHVPSSEAARAALRVHDGKDPATLRILNGR